MVKISAAEFICQVRRRAMELPSGHIEPLGALVSQAQSDTLEGKTIARALVGIITGREFDDADVFALSPESLSWITAFTERWAQRAYSDEELNQVVRLLDRPA